MIYINGIYIYSEQQAKDLFNSLGMDELDIEEPKELLCADDISELEYERDIAQEEKDNYELSLDHYKAAIDECLSVLDEVLQMQRITRARDRLENIRNILYRA